MAKRRRRDKSSVTFNSEGHRRLFEFSPSVIAAAVECNPGTASKWRTGDRKPTPGTRKKIELTLGIPEGTWNIPPGTTLDADPIPLAPPPETAETTLQRVERELARCDGLLEGGGLSATEQARLMDTAQRLIAVKVRIEKERELLEDKVVRQHPFWLRIKRTLVEALEPWPDAAGAVAGALEEIGA